MTQELETAVFGGGCFWCTEAVFQRLRGVKKVTSGYAGGSLPNPSYEAVSTGTTGHAEVIKVEYDPDEISYPDLLDVFFGTHDPTTLNRQGNDVGTQYRSVIFYANDEQKEKAEKAIQELSAQNVFDKPIVTTLEPLGTFYEAESYHKDYYNQNQSKPYCQVVISPKVKKLREKFAPLLRE